MPPRWRKTIDITTHVAGGGREIAALIRANTTGDEQADSELAEALETLESIDPTDGDYAIGEFNDALSDLQGWADRERIWLGPAK